MENHNLSIVYRIENKTVYILYTHLLFVLFLQTIYDLCNLCIRLQCLKNLLNMKNLNLSIENMYILKGH